MYFCGSTVTPGNGHDLSFLSGLVAASECGADFPYMGECMHAWRVPEGMGVILPYMYAEI